MHGFYLVYGVKQALWGECEHAPPVEVNVSIYVPVSMCVTYVLDACIYMYHISLNRRPGVYFLCDFADLAFKRGRRLFTSRISCPRPPTLCSARQGRNSLQFMRPYGKPRERQAHSIAFYLKDTSKHLFCAIEVAVGKVQLSPLSLPYRAVHVDYAPHPQVGTGPTRHLIEAQHLFAILPLIPPAFKQGRRLFKGGVYSRKYCMFHMLFECASHAHQALSVQLRGVFTVAF